MQIAVLGAGHIGGTIGEKWAQAGHSVHFGVRDPQKAEVQTLVKSLDGMASASSIAEAIDAGEIVLFAIPGGTMEATIKAHALALNSKIVIDAANNMRAPTPNSLAVFAAQTPHASVYRAFNSYGWENFKNPLYNGVAADLFYCGTDGAARTKIEQLIRDVGLNPIYVGSVDQVELVESVLKLWFTLTSAQGMGRHLAFKVLRD